MFHRVAIILIFLIVPTILLGGGQSESAPTQVQGEPVTLPDGLQYWDIAVGKGTPAIKGKRVRVHYTGWLQDGKKFDSSHDAGRPLVVTLGQGQVIPGWEEGLLGMKDGGKRQLRIPPSLAYGEEGSPPLIPANATLVFDVEMLNVER
jgi:FKBP-type peptidyl-prolyl cis-trans isomerase